MKIILEKYNKILKFKNYSKNTISIYNHYLKEFLISIDKSPSHIIFNDIKMYLEDYNYSSISKQNQIYSSLKLFSKFILNIKKLDKGFIGRPRNKKSLPQIIEKDFLLSQMSKIKNLKHKSIISLGYSVGLRVSEVINLELNDIDSKRMIIHIKNSKGNKNRIVPLTKNILQLLRKYFVEYKPKEYLFNGQNKLKYSTTSCNKIVKKYIGSDYHFHLLRHSCFTSLIENGTDIRIIQKLAGHKSIKTTEIYTHVSNDILTKINLPI